MEHKCRATTSSIKQLREAGKVKLHMTITQSEVDEHFAMLVPVFADFGNGMTPIAQVGIGGNSSRSFDMVLPSRPKLSR